MSRPVLFALAFTVAVTACGERNIPTTSSAPGTPAPSVRSPVSAREHLTAALARALGDPTVRAHFKRRLDASHAPEGKLQFQALLRSDQAMLLPAIARADAANITELLAELDAARPLEVYLPVEAQRAAWRGDDHFLVATLEHDGDAPIAYDASGNRLVLSATTPPSIPVIALVPQETDFTGGRPELAASCFDLCGGGTASSGGGTASLSPGTGLVITQSHFGDYFESWLKGKPEFEYHVYGTDDNGQSTQLACTGERAGGLYSWDQNTLDWTGSAMLLSASDMAAYQAQHPNAPVRIVAWEDDDEACVDHADAPSVTQVIAAVDAAYKTWTSGKVDPWYLRGIKAAPSVFNLLKTLHSIILTNDDLIGNAVESSIAGSAPGGANWTVKTDGTRTVGWFTTTYRQ